MVILGIFYLFVSHNDTSTTTLLDIRHTSNERDAGIQRTQERGNVDILASNT